MRFTAYGHGDKWNELQPLVELLLAIALHRVNIARSQGPSIRRESSSELIIEGFHWYAAAAELNKLLMSTRYSQDDLRSEIRVARQQSNTFTPLREAFEGFDQGTFERALEILKPEMPRTDSIKPFFTVEIKTVDTEIG